MMFMVREMYRHAVLSKWKVVFVTDRTQLERQLCETSVNVGFTVKVADTHTGHWALVDPEFAAWIRMNDGGPPGP